MDQNRALVMACLKDDVAAVQTALNQGADPNTFIKQSEEPIVESLSLLIAACFSDHDVPPIAKLHFHLDQLDLICRIEP